MKSTFYAAWQSEKMRVLALALFVAVLATVLSAAAYGYTPPSDGEVGYDFYDLVVKKGLNGPIGFVIGAWLLIDAGTTIGSNPKIAALKGIGGGALIKAEAIATTLGWMV